jgi:hypothetical protein
MDTFFSAWKEVVTPPSSITQLYFQITQLISILHN